MGSLCLCFEQSTQKYNKKEKKMKLAMAAFLVLLVAIGLVSSAKLNDKLRVARGGIPMPEMCSGCYRDHYSNAHCYNGECWNNGVSVGRCRRGPVYAPHTGPASAY